VILAGRKMEWDIASLVKNPITNPRFMITVRNVVSVLKMSDNGLSGHDWVELENEFKKMVISLVQQSGWTKQMIIDLLRSDK